jgi:alkanesulfonate monooxygenase SsuD/methylene tetrahydromethanopterin reductase-like flavin-dependent oxidoreductase (luciferase family)
MECGDPRFLVELAERAEAAGWDGVFLEDYVVFQGDPRAPTCDSWVALAGMAARTKSVVLGTSVTPLARRRPWVVARQAAAIDQLSEGRMVLGAGLGDVGDHVGRDASFTHFHEELDARRRARMLDEALEIIAGLWIGEPFSFNWHGMKRSTKSSDQSPKWRAITIRWTSLVPSPISRIFWSR